MSKELGLDPSLLISDPLTSEEYMWQVVASLREMITRCLRLEDFEQSLTYMQKLYSPAMLGTCCGVGEQHRLKPFVCVLYMVNIVSKYRMKQSSRLARLISSEKRVLFDAHVHLFNVSDKMLEDGKNWDSGVYGAFVMATLRTLQLGEAEQPPGW